MAESQIQPLTTARRSALPASTALRAGEGHEPTADELRRRVSGRFRSLAVTTGALRRELRATADWKTQARRHPRWVLGLAVATGLIAVRAMRRRRGPLAARMLSVVAGVVIRRMGRRFGSKGR